MKTLTLFLAIFTLAFACSSSNKESNQPSYNNLLKEVKTIYPNFEKSTRLVYDNNNYITEIIRSANGIDEDVIKFIYDRNGKIERINYLYDSTLTRYRTLKWYADSLHLTRHDIEDGKDIVKYRDTYVYNKDGNITKVARYKKDSIGKWIPSSFKYEFTWVNGNMVHIKNYVRVLQENNDTVNDYSGYKMLEPEETNSKVVSKKEFELFYEADITYDNMKNPYKNYSISSLILPNKRPTSINNPLSVVKKYSDGEKIELNFNYKYTENGLPDKADILIKTNDKETDGIRLTVDYMY